MQTAVWMFYLSIFFFRDSKISAAVLYVSSYCDMVQ